MLRLRAINQSSEIPSDRNHKLNIRTTYRYLRLTYPRCGEHFLVYLFRLVILNTPSVWDFFTFWLVDVVADRLTCRWILSRLFGSVNWHRTMPANSSSFATRADHLAIASHYSCHINTSSGYLSKLFVVFSRTSTLNSRHSPHGISYYTESPSLMYQSSHRVRYNMSVANKHYIFLVNL